MKVTTTKFIPDINILKFDHIVSKAFSVDFDGITETDNGFKIMKAGTIMKGDGKKATTTDTPVGVLLHNVREDNPNTALIIHGFIDKTKAETNVGNAYDETLLAKLPMVSFL